MKQVRRSAWLGPHWLRLVGWIPVGGLLVFVTWLFATEAGLQFAIRAAHRATGGALSIARAEGTLGGIFELTDVRYEVPAATVTIDRAALSLRLLPLLAGRVQAQRLDIDALFVQTHAAPVAPGPREKLSLRMPLALAVEAGHVAGFRIRIAEDGWRWEVPQADFAAQWSGRWLVIARARAQTHEAGEVVTRGRLAFEDDRLLIEDLEVRGTGTAQVEGALALHDDAENDLTARWRDLRWIRADELAWLRSPRGHATLKGPWRNYHWSTRGDVEFSGVPGELDASGRGSLAALTLKRALLKTLGGSVTGEGKVEWSPALVTAFALSWQGIDPGTYDPGWPGTLNGQGRFDATWLQKSVRMNFDAALAGSTLRGFPLALQVSGRTEGDAVWLKTLRAQSGASSITAQGQLLPKFGLDGALASTDLRSLWAGLSGGGKLTASLRGTQAAPELVLRGALENLAYARYRAGRASVDATLAPQGRSQVALDLADVRAGATLKQLNLRAQGTRAKHEATLEARNADGVAQLAVSGGLKGLAWHGTLTAAHIAPARGEDWTLDAPADIAWVQPRLEVQPVCLSSRGSRACAGVTVAPGVLEIVSRMRDFDVAHLKPWLPGDLMLIGVLSGDAELKLAGGDVKAITVDLKGGAGSVSAGGSTLKYGPGELRIAPEENARNGRLHATVHLTPAGGDFDGDVWVAGGGGLLDRPMLGELRVHLPDLSWLPVLSTEIGSAQGSLDSRLQVSGTPRSPKLDGKLELADGRVQLVTPGIELSGITASFSREKAAPLALHAEAQSGGGTLVVDGALKQLQPEVLGEIAIRGENVQGFNTNELRAWLSPDLKLTLAEGLARLTGTLAVPRAEITPRELARGGVGPTSDQVLVEDSGAAHGKLLRIETQVKIALGDNVKFDGLGLKTRLTGAITALDDPERPTRGVGELRLDGGRYKAYGQDLTIETGRLIFNGGPVTDPAVDLIAFRKPTEAVKVGLRARGTLEAPEFSLFSEPPMSQEETLSWLVLGRSLSGTLDSAQQTQLSGAALSLGLTGGEYLAQQLAPRLGLDQVSLGAKPGDTADLARFTVGKYLSPKLFVSYGVGLFQPGHFFRMQYDLSKHFKLQGESGTTQGGDVLYTIEK